MYLVFFFWLIFAPSFKHIVSRKLTEFQVVASENPDISTVAVTCELNVKQEVLVTIEKQ